MNINITLFNIYLQHNGCPTQIFVDTSDSKNGSVLKFLRGNDENGSCTVFLSFDEIDEILEANNVESKMIAERDITYEQLMSRPEKDRDISKNIHDILYGVLAKYIIQLFAASTGVIIYPDLQITPNHKKTYLASALSHQAH